MRIKLYFFSILLFFYSCKQESDFTSNYLCKYNWLFVEDIHNKKIFFTEYHVFDKNGSWDQRVIKTNERYLGKIYKWSFDNNYLYLADEFRFKIINYNKDSIVMLNDKNKKVYFVNLKIIKKVSLK